jgi:hypothetical protein
MVQNKLNNPTLTRDGVKNSIIPIQCIIVQYITNISLTAMGRALAEPEFIHKQYILSLTAITYNYQTLMQFS